MKITGWIQVCDYSLTELGAVSFEQATDLVLSFPWSQRLHEFAEKVLHEEDACPPGVGFNTEEEDVFHVYAGAIDEWQIRLRLSRPGRIFWLFRRPAKTLDVEVKAIKQVVELLRLFFDRNKERLAVESADYPSREAYLPTLG